jgi:hypothetical protein
MQATNDLEAAVMIAINKGWPDRNRAKSYLSPQRESIFPHVENVQGPITTDIK